MENADSAVDLNSLKSFHLKVSKIQYYGDTKNLSFNLCDIQYKNLWYQCNSHECPMVNWETL